LHTRSPNGPKKNGPELPTRSPSGPLVEVQTRRV
jgi:hypothetical protein